MTSADRRNSRVRIIRPADRLDLPMLPGVVSPGMPRGRPRNSGSKHRPPSKIREDQNRVHFPKTYVPGTHIALLSRPTKMPGPSWSLPAGPACPFAVYGENAICSSCYAGPRHKGRYAQRAIREAQAARFAWAAECMRSDPGYDEFVEAMYGAIELATRARYKYMRIHDSGDFFSARYTRAWFEICQALPKIHFWCPTRSWRAPWLSTIQELAALPNVAVRPSALYFDDLPPIVPGLAAGTTAAEFGFTCPAPRQDNHCGSCRTCWDAQETAVSYHAH